MKLLNTIRILSRKSDLANIQAKEVGLLLKEKYPELSIEYITKSTSDDKDLKTPLSEMPEPGVFRNFIIGVLKTIIITKVITINIII